MVLAQGVAAEGGAAQEASSIVSTPATPAQFKLEFPAAHAEGAVVGRGWNYGVLDEFDIYMWRENGHVWMEIIPITAQAFICGVSFSVKQDRKSYFSGFKLETESGQGWCNNLAKRHVFRFTTYPSTRQIPDLTGSFEVILNTVGNKHNHSLRLPAAGPKDVTDPGNGSIEDTPTPKACTGYGEHGYTCPEVIGEAPAVCPDGYVGVPAMRIPLDAEGGTLDVDAFCVSPFANADAAVPDRQTVPQTDLSFFQAQENCALGGARLIRESQWMALAHNITLADANWSGGKVGKGDIKGGFNSEQCKTGTGPLPYSTCPDSLAPGRARVLTNGATVYDVGGNLWQWTFHDLETGVAGEFTALGGDQVAAPYESGTRGMGAFMSFGGLDTDADSLTDWSGYAPIRGGDRGSAKEAGPFALSGGVVTEAYPDVGFRCAVAKSRHDPAPEPTEPSRQ